MVSTTVIPLNFCCFPPHFQVQMFVHEVQCAADGSPFVLHLLVWRKSHYTFSQTLMFGLIFIKACLFIAMTLFLLVPYTNMNFVQYLTICHEIVLAVERPATLTLYCIFDNDYTCLCSCFCSSPNYSCFLRPSFTGVIDVEDFLTQFENVSTLSNRVALTLDPRAHFISARLTGDDLTSYRSLTTAQKAATMISSDYSSSNTSRRLTFWRSKLSPFANSPAMMCPLSSGHSVTLQKRFIPKMPWAMSSSSPHSSKDWLNPLFGGKCEKLNQQWLRTHLIWHLNCNIIWTSTAKTPTLPRRLLTNWPVPRYPKLNSFPISFSLSRKKLNES